MSSIQGSVPTTDINEIPRLNKQVKKLRLLLEVIQEHPHGQPADAQTRVRAELSQTEATLERLKEKAVAMRHALLQGGCF
jgi:hypothetical protein